MHQNGSAADDNAQSEVGLSKLAATFLLALCAFITLYTPALNSRNARAEAAEGSRFFFAGNGRLELEHAHFSERLTVRYRQGDGYYNPAALAEINRFFRSRADERIQPIPLRLVELLAYIQTRHSARPMVLLSGYRSSEFNNALGAQGQAVAFASLHTQGLAADIALPRVDLRKLWLRLRAEQIGGVGFYRSQRFLHVDVGPPRFWEESTSRVSENLSAGNARMFARTDFDRYTSLDGARITIHSVTAWPVRIAAGVQADLAGGCPSAQLAAIDPSLVLEGGCWVIHGPAPRYEFEVRHSASACTAPRGKRLRLLLATCEPRVGRTPHELVTNAIELR